MRRAVEVRLLENYGVDTKSWYGKTNVYLDLWILKDATIAFEEDVDRQGRPIQRVTFEPEDAVAFDLDSSGWWVVHVAESLLGIPDLDEFLVREIVEARGYRILRGTSGGKKVEIRGGRAKVTVDGVQTYPERGR